MQMLKYFKIDYAIHMLLCAIINISPLNINVNIILIVVIYKLELFLIDCY